MTAMKPLVVVTRNIPQAALRLLRDHFRLDHHDRPTPLPRRDLLRRLRRAEGLLCLLSERVDAELFDAAPRLRMVATFSAGLDHIDLPEAERRGILVSHTPGVLAETCADYTWALLLAGARRVVEGDRLVRAGRFRGWDPLLLLGADVHGKTLGLVGFGRIGQAVARRAAGFRMTVLYCSPHPAPRAVERRLGAVRVPLAELLRRSDFVTLHAALSPETRYLIDARRLALMKRTAFLINGARGPIVDERALLRALRRKRLAGAALDVYETEPRLTPGLRGLPNVVLSPHLASASLETRAAMGRLAADSLVEYLIFGRRPGNAVHARPHSS
ncbi:MAG: hypothetical protein A2X36_09340 [Elusimicrobia bacterium GWA2_69_24]|nr:MAG: hypothetical protein A2X36_09340 [Elusimicrobia bacterium GWA2_69_24]